MRPPSNIRDEPHPICEHQPSNSVIFAAQHRGVDQRWSPRSYPHRHWRVCGSPQVRGTSMENLALSGRSILVVEDEPLIALDIRKSLESAGAYVFAATQHPHALQLAGHPDLSAAVLDCRLGQDDTSAICSRLEERDVPFMFYSGHDDMHRLWPNAMHVPKPANAHELLEAVKGMFGSPLEHATSRAA